MKRLASFLFKVHKCTGIFISAFFFMWFVTGVVLIYHPYPRLSEKQFNDMKETLPSSLPDLETISQRVKGEAIKRLIVRQFQDQTLLDIKTAKNSYLLNADTGQSVRPIDFAVIESVAKKWIDAPVIKVDTLHKRKQWVLYSRYERELPIYKFSFDDINKSQLFVSGRTADVQQLTTAKQRFWAYIGAIPHKLYVPALRRDVNLWMDTFVVGASICLAAALSGFIFGLYIFIRRKKVTGKWSNPYRKKWQRVHFSLGLVFGIFLIAWAISGIFAMSRVPQWLIKTEAPFSFDRTRLWGKNLLPLDVYKLSFDKVKETYPELKQISLARFADIPAYIIVEGQNERYIDASGDEVTGLVIPQHTIENGFRNIYGPDTHVKVSVLDEYDNYYINLRRTYKLPVYKVEVDNSDRDIYYISPLDGYIKYLNKNKKADKWLFSAIHYLNVPCLLNRPWLWTICIWVLCAGCAVVCLSGVVLGAKSIIRKK